MADRAREKGRTERYLPKAAWASMSKEERRATDEKKKRESKGKPVKSTRRRNDRAGLRGTTCPCS